MVVLYLDLGVSQFMIAAGIGVVIHIGTFLFF